MVAENVPHGQYYHELYLKKEPPTESIPPRARFRIGKIMESRSIEGAVMHDWIEQEMGLRVPYNGGPRYGTFVEDLSIRDLAKVVTLVYRYLGYREKVAGRAYSYMRDALWVIAVERIFREENVAYEVDKLGGVHPLVDAEFAKATDATIRGLHIARYDNVRAELQKGLDAIDGIEPDWKGGMRGTFYAAEAMYKLMYPVDRLTSKTIRERLQPLAKAVGDKAASASQVDLTKSFEAWSDSAQDYRHEQGLEEPHQPPADNALLFISQGLAFLRWLAALDEA